MIPALIAAVSLAVQPDTGALALALDGTPVITGVLSQYPLKIARTVVRQESPAHDTVNVVYTDGSSAVYTYTLDGNDCTLDYTLSNASGKPLNIDLSGLNCVFAPGTTLNGTLPHWHWTYYQNPKVWHPGVLSPLGAVYAANKDTATVFYSPSEFGRQSLINASWSLSLSVPNPFQLEFHTQRAIAPGGAGSAGLVMRVTNDFSQEGLHGGYKKFLAGNFPRPTPSPMAARWRNSPAWIRLS